MDLHFDGSLDQGDGSGDREAAGLRFTGSPPVPLQRLQIAPTSSSPVE